MYLEYCTKEQLSDIYGEFEATEESVQKDVEHLKEWLQNQPHLPNVTDDGWLANVLLRCKINLEKTKEQLDCYYTGRAEMPDIFSNRDPRSQDIKNCLDVVTSLPARCLTPEGYRITFAKIFEHTKENLPTAEILLKTLQIQCDVHAQRDQVKGVIIVVDFEHISMPFFTLSLSILRRSWMMLTKLNKVRLHKIYILNCTPVVEVLIKLSKSVISRKLAKRFEVWSRDPSELAEVLPSKHLPSNYGGEERSLEELRDLWYNYLTTFHEWFAAEEDVKADLTKKPSSGGVSYFFRNMFRANAAAGTS